MVCLFWFKTSLSISLSLLLVKNPSIFPHTRLRPIFMKRSSESVSQRGTSRSNPSCRRCSPSSSIPPWELSCSPPCPSLSIALLWRAQAFSNATLLCASFHIAKSTGDRHPEKRAKIVSSKVENIVKGTTDPGIDCFDQSAYSAYSDMHLQTMIGPGSDKKESA